MGVAGAAEHLRPSAATNAGAIAASSSLNSRTSNRIVRLKAGTREMTSTLASANTTELDVAIVGAGFAGLHMLYRALNSERNVKLFEAGSGVGGTWYWNRYPGARVDIESLEYSYSFSEELQQEWKWSERYSAQPELLRYANHVADRFNLRPHIQFNSPIASTIYDEQAQRWTLTTTAGEKIRAKFCILATGLLYIPKAVPIDGLENYEGMQLFTSQWPEDVDLSGRRVVVIGTGSTGVQCIQEIGKVASHLTVLQRTPSFCIPVRNRPTDPDFDRAIKSQYKEIREKQLQTLAGFLPLTFMDSPNPTKNAMDVSDEERQSVYDERWAAGGLSFYTAFKDLLVDPAANETLAEYVRNKIRERVKDPETAEKLVPKGFPILARRLATETDYYETFNQDNVTLIDVNEEPIQRATPDGIVVGEKFIPCDVIVFATGFDALTGAIENIDIRGRGGETIKEHWAGGVETYAGLMCHGFPNLLFMNGPGSPSGFWAPIQIAEYQADWIERCFDFLEQNGLESIEPTVDEEKRWSRIVAELADQTLFTKVKSWYQGDNIPGKPHRMMIYLGGYTGYREECEQAVEEGYSRFILTKQSATERLKALSS
ncbi:NAD(P)/FAD-dependent oxidoreductase [Sphingosinicella sp. LY1275]|uniref:flavin-containing monooxygenase n=1 Tax=Sphingosinicella sp. LY1275 TaxID=3095379 RepID=UPI002ADEEE1C|nr:NAD(P)/FAD-dependent oxidoreductase [Sphingosinicella sp. LY1275]MEA1015247.1 NAD(P)/FAD-dependent oxidoreductase [Sphingosinicella sp. LY1275]